MYQPKTLSEIVGQVAISSLIEYAKRPVSKCWLFEGDGGCGKSATAQALANDLGCERQWGGLTVLPASELTIDSARHLFERELMFRPMRGSGWRAVIIEELDGLSSQQLERYLKVMLDRANLRPKTCVVATTNDASRIDPILKQRFDHRYFGNGDYFREACLELLPKLWAQHTTRPMPTGWQGWGDIEGGYSMRLAVFALEDALPGAEVAA